ncbi:MAG: asparaginase domain-containing protein [Termitinemataceae bacterium]
MEGIRILITGGTFDKQYDELKGVLTFKNSHLPDIIRQARITIPVELEINQLIDSLEMKEEDRQNILAACKRAPEKRILITHGTDRMVETAKVLGASELANTFEKTIVLTGAMIPYAVAGSDSLFNLGCAFTAVQLLPPGVYITMNGRVFPWDRVRKNYDKGVFESL